MNHTNGSEDWRVLCELASKEEDPKKLLEIITKINQSYRSSTRNLAPGWMQPNNAEESTCENGS